MTAPREIAPVIVELARHVNAESNSAARISIRAPEGDVMTVVLLSEESYFELVAHSGKQSRAWEDRL